MGRTALHYYHRCCVFLGVAADYLQENLEAKGVAVVLKARHLCMEMRGVKTSDTNTITSKLLGYFRTDERTRAEFLNLIGNHRN